jgi:peptidyl-prolyl cis-trans isomerase A (cyclophilin A)
MNIGSRTALILCAAALLAGCQPQPPPAPKSEKPPEPPKEIPTMVTLKTSKGDITLELYADKAPATVANFLAYVDSGHYKGTIFHRVIPNFMIQGGGMTADMAEKSTRAPVRNEAGNGLKNDRGTIAMARTSDPDSATAQFFINVVNNGGLNRPSPDGYGYCVFGRVTAGLDVVDAIRAVPTGDRGPHQNVPLEPVTILDAARVAAK